MNNLLWPRNGERTRLNTKTNCHPINSTDRWRYSWCDNSSRSNTQTGVGLPPGRQPRLLLFLFKHHHHQGPSGRNRTQQKRGRRFGRQSIHPSIHPNVGGSGGIVRKAKDLMRRKKIRAVHGGHAIFANRRAFTPRGNNNNRPAMANSLSNKQKNSSSKTALLRDSVTEKKRQRWRRKEGAANGEEG